MCGIKSAFDFLFPDCPVVGGGRSHSWDPTWSMWKGSCTATPCRKSDLQETTTTRWHCSPSVSLSYINDVLSLHSMLHYSTLLSHNMPNYSMLVLYHVRVCFITLYCIIVTCHHHHILSPTLFYYMSSQSLFCDAAICLITSSSMVLSSLTSHLIRFY